MTDRKRIIKCMVALLFLLVSIHASHAGEPGVTMDANNRWEIATEKYQAKSGRLGFLGSVVTGGKEFLDQSKNLPGGFYFCANGMPGLENVRKTDERTVTGQNKLGQVIYEFGDDEIVCTVTSKVDGLHVYILMHKEVETVVTGQGKMLEVPTKAACTDAKWIQDEAALNISGINSIWGPWHGVQVVDVALAKGEKRVIRLTPMSVYKTGDKELEKQETSVSLRQSFTYGQATEPAQIPICMIGDSITWAGDGDCWRKELLKLIPRLAFVGTHTARLGYSHAGEGGNNTQAVLARLDAIPDCPNYVLHIGTNNNNVKTAALVDKVARGTADQIKQIVQGLLGKQGVEKVFLCAVFPCHTNNPLRDKCNAATNVYLRKELSELPADKVVWVEYEHKLRALKGWEQLIQLHPTQKGYKHVARILAESLIDTFQISDPRTPVQSKPDTGVRVYNLWNESSGQTTGPVIAGWYTLSMRIKEVTGEKPAVVLSASDTSVRFPLHKVFAIKGKAGQRVWFSFFTGYERYDYSRTSLKITVKDCKVEQVMLEKTRPSQKPSAFGKGSFIDATSQVFPGELVEFCK